MSIRLRRSPISWYSFNHVFDVAYSANNSHKVTKRVRIMQPLNRDLFQNELSYLSMNIIYALPYCHLPYKPKNSVPDAESQRQHDSWSTQWSLFEFPGKDSHCQEAKYGTHDFSCHHLFTRSFNPFPHLKNGNFFGLISTVSPVLGFLPVYPSYVLAQKEHRPRISTRSPFSSAVAIWLKNMDTILVASILVRPFVVLRSG